MLIFKATKRKNVLTTLFFSSILNTHQKQFFLMNGFIFMWCSLTIYNMKAPKSTHPEIG